MRDDADPALMALWARGWTLTRGAPPPEPIPDGWRIEANMPTHRWRFVYPALCDEVVAQAQATLPDPFAFRIAAAPEHVRAALPFNWAIDVPAFVMTANPRGAVRRSTPLDGYTMTHDETAPGASLVTILNPGGELAASGRLALIDDLAVFDRIRTQEPYQRRGLGSLVMTRLGAIADEAKASRWALTATIAGRALYETLGWEVHAPYTTAYLRPGA